MVQIREATQTNERSTVQSLVLSLAVPVFAAWTLFVWGGRLRNLWQEPGPLSDVSTWSLVGSIIFTVAAFDVAVLWAANRFSKAGNSGLRRAGLRLLVCGLGAFTAVVWLIRAVDIVRGDHTVPFIVVHVVLAVVSIGLAALAVRSVLDDRSVIASTGSGEPGRAPVG